MVSDSHCPDSDILDCDVSNTGDMNLSIDVSKFRRKSSADTCKDIDDIEDFEFDSNDMKDDVDSDEKKCFMVDGKT